MNLLLATHWNYLRSFTKYFCLGTFPRDSDLIGIGLQNNDLLHLSLGLRWKSVTVGFCEPNLALQINAIYTFNITFNGKDDDYYAIWLLSTRSNYKKIEWNYMVFIHDKARFPLGDLDSLSFWLHWWGHSFGGTLWSELWSFSFLPAFSYFKSIQKSKVKRWVTTRHSREHRRVKEESKRKRKNGKKMTEKRVKATEMIIFMDCLNW